MLNQIHTSRKLSDFVDKKSFVTIEKMTEILVISMVCLANFRKCLTVAGSFRNVCISKLERGSMFENLVGR